MAVLQPRLQLLALSTESQLHMRHMASPQATLQAIIKPMPSELHNLQYLSASCMASPPYVGHPVMVRAPNPLSCHALDTYPKTGQWRVWAAHLCSSVHLQAGALLSVDHLGIALAAGQRLDDADALQPVPGVRCAREQALRKGAARLKVPCAQLNFLRTCGALAGRPVLASSQWSDDISMCRSRLVTIPDPRQNTCVLTICRNNALQHQGFLAQLSKRHPSKAASQVRHDLCHCLLR